MPMPILPYIANFFAGLFFCNCIPHITCGLSGESFPTPFSKPSGVGFSSAVLNFLWGFFNLFAGLVLCYLVPISIGFNAGFIVLLVGFLLVGIFNSWHFSTVKSKRDDESA
jgi:hypothetical protein